MASIADRLLRESSLGIPAHFSEITRDKGVLVGVFLHAAGQEVGRAEEVRDEVGSRPFEQFRGVSNCSITLVRAPSGSSMRMTGGR
ncbi:hypothetical protein GCM10010094_89730 [Streptomyces flaveus]|uniref:Uncharacterized protein n=1 Tax=Streptomyces flaveus TaxID=66370 RepID=A0A917RM05_9ACTN|nr:hypothetical protein GCM10010094_89730 [Streptomyces flaveus]